MGVDLVEFVSSLNLSTQAETILAIMYYYEQVLLIKEFTPKDIRDAFEQSRQANPSNVSQVLSKLRQRKLINRTKNGSYSLTTAGKNEIAKK